MKDNGNVKTKSSAELRAMRDGRQTAPVSSRQQRLDSYREVIVRRQRDFVETGTALGLIAKDGLFKEAGFASFEAMITGEFDMSTSTAYRLVDAARVVTILSQVGTVESKIKNQTQALALAPLGKDREAMVLTIAAAEARGRLTAEVLADVRVELYPHTRVIDGEVVPEKPALVKGMRKAIEQAAASVGTGVTYTPAQTSVTLCPVPRDLDNCNICGVRLAERNGGYLRCPGHDPHQEHIATATLDGLWAECRLCYPTSAAGPAANPEDASPVLGEPVEVEQPQAGAGPESDGTGLGSGQIEERIEEEAVEPPADTPAAGATVPPPDEAYPPSSLPAQQPGPDSPTGIEGSRSETDEEFDEELRRINDGIVEAVAAAIDTEAGLAAITGHHTSAGVSDVGGAPEVAASVEQGLEDGGTAQDPSSSSDPWDSAGWSALIGSFNGSSPDHIVDLFHNMAFLLDRVDVDVIGPLLTEADVKEVHDAADIAARVAGLIETWRTA